MPEYNTYDSSNFLKDWKNNQEYFEMLGLLSSLSRLFSESGTPYLDYRLAENLFCRYFRALNDARSCTAYDARIQTLGIGIKTFILNSANTSVEKIAEFNKLRPQLVGLSGKTLAVKLAEYRNQRMLSSNAIYGVNSTKYHIVGRKDGLLKVFNTAYDYVDIENIHNVKENDASISFCDEKHEYSFNKSKSVLQMRFELSADFKDVPISIVDDPLNLLKQIFQRQNLILPTIPKQKGRDFVILPLYSTREHNVQERAGLNQWNAAGRPREWGEVYIRVPASIHHKFPNFFPQNKDEKFVLRYPNGHEASAKMCQSGLKGLMTNPNTDLGVWLLKDVFGKKEGELVTMADLDRLGMDSIYVEKLVEKTADGLQIYSISFSNEYERYESFIN